MTQVLVYPKQVWGRGRMRGGTVTRSGRSICTPGKRQALMREWPRGPPGSQLVIQRTRAQPHPEISGMLVGRDVFTPTLGGKTLLTQEACESQPTMAAAPFLPSKHKTFPGHKLPLSMGRIRGGRCTIYTTECSERSESLLEGATICTQQGLISLRETKTA